MQKYLLIFLFASLSASAQKATIKKIELSGEKIIVYYDLDDDNPNNEYQMNLFISKDKFTTPVSKVKGDVGNEIKPGSGKKIEWNIFEEFTNYNGDIEIEIRGKVFVPFVKLQSFGTKQTLKRGKAYDMAWRPGNTNPVHVEVFRGSQRMQGELNLPNNGKYTLNLSPHLKPGGSYKVKITDSKKTNDFVYTEEFKVRRKVPLLLKALPIIGAGAFIGMSAGGSKGAAEISGPPALPTN